MLFHQLNAFLFGVISTVNIRKNFIQSSSKAVSAAGLLSALSGKVPTNTEKHPENISCPVRSYGPLLNNRMEEVPGNGQNLASGSCSRKSEPMGNGWGM